MKGSIPRQFIDDLLTKSNIVDVINARVKLKKAGRDYQACCPFHHEKTPSFTVSEKKQFYYCFGCGAKGNAISFLMDYDKLEFVEAVEELAASAGIEVPYEKRPNQFGNKPDVSYQTKRNLYDLMQEIASFYQAQLPLNIPAQSYLQQRGLSPDIIDRFQIGYVPNTMDTVLRQFGKNREEQKKLFDLGMLSRNDRGNVYDKFRNRIMFPIRDKRGRTVAFGGRVLTDEKPKYLNSPETITYHKGNELYGLYEALQINDEPEKLLVVEGYMDVVTLHQAGFDNAVACMGTALTQEQIRLLSRFTKELVLCYDNDGAGQMATDRALELLQNSEFTVKVLRLPQRLVDGHYVKQDADDFIKYQGRDAFEQLLSGSANGIEFTMSEIASKYDLKDDKGRIAYAGEIAETLCKLNDPVEREVYTTRAAEAASLPVEAMRMEVQRAAKRVQAKARKAQERQEMNPISALQPADRSIRYQNVRSALAEEGVIRLLMQDESLFPPEMPVQPEEVSSPLLGRIYGELWQRRGHASMAALAAVLTPEEMNHLTALLQKPESAANAPQALADYIRIIREEHTKRTGGTDPLAAAMETYKDKKGYGGKRT